MASDETRHGADQKAASFIKKLRAQQADIVPQPPSDDTPPQDTPTRSVTSEGFTIMRNNTGGNARRNADASAGSPAKKPKAQTPQTEENIEASIAMALETMEPADKPSAATAEDMKLDAAIDEIIADESAAADHAPGAIMPGSFGAAGETGVEARSADAAPAETSRETPATDNMNEKQATTMIGKTMAQAIKSIVHDEMSQTIDLIARRAVRDAFRQA